MIYTEFMSIYDPAYKCYAVHTDPKTLIIERDLILDSPHFSLSNEPYIQINNFHSAVYLRDITDIIVTKMKWVA